MQANQLFIQQAQGTNSWIIFPHVEAFRSFSRLSEVSLMYWKELGFSNQFQMAAPPALYILHDLFMVLFLICKPRKRKPIHQGFCRIKCIQHKSWHSRDWHAANISLLLPPTSNVTSVQKTYSPINYLRKDKRKT